MINQLIRNLTRKFFHNLYHQLSWGYDFIANIASGGQWFEWGEQCQKFFECGDIILEIGFGTGHLLNKIIKQKKMAIGIDKSYQMVTLAKKRTPTGSFFQGNVNNIPIKASTFDIVISNFPSEYIFEEQAILNMFKILKLSGKVIILIGVTFHGKNLLDLIYRFVYFILGQTISKKTMADLLNLKPFLIFPKREYVVVEYKNRKLHYLILGKV